VFISSDLFSGAMSDPVSLHKYLYANANPATYSDPAGKSAALQKQLETISIIGILSSIPPPNFAFLISFIQNNRTVSLPAATSAYAIRKLLSAILPTLRLRTRLMGRLLGDFISLPNTTAEKKDKNSKVNQEQKYGSDGNTTEDIDYTDHGNPKANANPHRPTWMSNSEGNLTRGGLEPIK
jgi:hypothetical protein